MNKAISLPRIGTQRPEITKKITSKQRRNSIEIHHGSMGRKQQNEEERFNIIGRKQIKPIQRVKSEFLRKSTDQVEENTKLRKYELKQNGRLKKIEQINPPITYILNTERSSRTMGKQQNQNKQKVALIKKQLNQIKSSVLILKKEIKAIEGGTLQFKQQNKAFSNENITAQNTKVQIKIEEVRKKTEFFKYDQQILKNMKDRLKRVIIHLEKKTADMNETLKRQQNKSKFLNRRYSVHQQSINKKKQQINVIQQKQRTANILAGFNAEQYHRRIKNLNTQKELSNNRLTSINSDYYHYEVYKKQQANLLEQIKSNSFLKSLLQSKWNKYSQLYAEVQKAQKILQMHSIIKTQGDFNPSKVYFDSFQNKKELEDKIRKHESRVAELVRRNQELKKVWQNIEFNQTQEQQKIVNSKPLQIKTGRTREQSELQAKQREQVAQVRRKREIQKDRCARIFEIRDWVTRLEKLFNLQVLPIGSLDERIEHIIKETVKQHRSRNHSSINRND